MHVSGNVLLIGGIITIVLGGLILGLSYFRPRGYPTNAVNLRLNNPFNLDLERSFLMSLCGSGKMPIRNNGDFIHGKVSPSYPSKGGFRYMIQVKNVEKSFGSQKVLSCVNFEVENGEIFGLLGPSGAGKTTLINILTKQLEPDGGTAHVGATSFETGLMLDEDGLYPRLNCLENLHLFVRIYGIPTEKSMEALQSVGLEYAAKKAVSALSKGMRQRLALARAILHSPKILFLDEPTSGLDPSTALGIHELIRGLREDGATIFLTTHNMDEAVKLCDRVVLMHKGKIVEHGKPLEICERHNSMRTVPDLGSVFINMTGVGLV